MTSVFDILELLLLLRVRKIAFPTLVTLHTINTTCHLEAIRLLLTSDMPLEADIRTQIILSPSYVILWIGSDFLLVVYFFEAHPRY